MTIPEAEIQTSTQHSDGLPDGWRKVRFGDVVRNVDIAERNPLEHGIERYIGLEHIDPESLTLNQ